MVNKDEIFGDFVIRKYCYDDLSEIAELFYNTVHAINCRDYNAQQLDVWATGHVDKERWHNSLMEHYSIVAVSGGSIIGFGDIDNSGYLDRIYTHKDYQGMGIATAICNELEGCANTTIVTAHVSITAKPFFERRGYTVEREQQVERNGILLTNYIMVLYK